MAKAPTPKDGIVITYGRFHATISGRLAIKAVTGLAVLYLGGRALGWW